MIKNNTNGKIYIGKTINSLNKRIKQHIYSKSNIGKLILILGKDNFEFKILEKCIIDLLNEREVYWISKYNSFKGDGYNLTSGGERLGGYLHCEETKQKISKKVSGINNGMFGKVGNLKNKTGSKHPAYGIKRSNKHKKIISERMKIDNPSFYRDLSGENHPNSKLNLELAIEIILKYEELSSYTEVGILYNVSRKTIKRIIKLEHWSVRNIKNIKILVENKKLEVVYKNEL